ncbi:MAG: ABC transporter substrate-binding protein, partial [Candidatus Thorarchaeota archaeon]
QAVTGSPHESPMLAERVATGELPPLEERLPKEPAVAEPREAVGEYFDELRLIGYYEGQGIFTGFTESMQQGLLTIDPDYTAFQPNIAKDWELAEDGKSLTFYLREGMKWSDGDDFTADDFEFWYNDILQDPDLTASISENWMPGGELMGFSKIDDYTVRFNFAVPYYRAIEAFAGSLPAAPQHFIKQYMPKYNDGAEELATAEGFESWQQAVQFHIGATSIAGSYNSDPLAPTLNPWVIQDLGADSAVWVRNPYYWRVDTAGNQLPYADTLLVLVTENIRASGPVRTMAGDIDLTEPAALSLADYPVLKKKEAEGGYRVYLWTRADQSFAMGFALNYAHKDEVLREIFNDLRFRQALSLAINRDEISENIFLGLTEPWTAPVSAAWTGYEDWMGTYFAEYDVDRANELLDEMGLEWDDAHEYRLRPDGQPISIVGTYCTEWLAYSEDLLDLVSIYWKAIGVKFEPKFVPEETLQTLFVANETDIGISNSDGGAELVARSDYPIRLLPPWHWGEADCCPMAAYPWRQWLDTNGEQGIEPPDDIKRIWDLTWQWLEEPYGTERYRELINVVITLNVRNLYYFGTVSSAPMVAAASERLVNVPRDDGVFNAWGITPYLPETWFLRK